MNAPVRDLHPSNLVTYLALAAAVGAVAAAGKPGGIPLAGACLALAAVADAFDGRFARLFTRTPRQSRTGAELDSLVDVVAFGVAPVVVFASTTSSTGVRNLMWWGAAFAFVLSAVTRLAFFNVEGDDTRFVGVPMPAIALVCSTALLPGVLPLATASAPLLFLVCAVAMVAPLPIPRPSASGLALVAAWGVVLVAVHGQALR